MDGKIWSSYLEDSIKRTINFCLGDEPVMNISRKNPLEQALDKFAGK